MTDKFVDWTSPETTWAEMKERPKWERRLYLNGKLGRGENLTEEEQRWADGDRDWWGRYT